MKRTPGVVLLALVALLNWSVQGGSTPGQTLKASLTTNSQPSQAVVGVAATSSSNPGEAKLACAGSLQDVFDELFGPNVVVAGSSNGQKAPKPTIRFLIASVPDPKHTHLALAFDRMVEGIQQAAVEERYTFQSTKDLPWAPEDERKGGEGGGVNGSGSPPVAVADAEKCPGALVFRRHWTDAKKTAAKETAAKETAAKETAAKTITDPEEYLVVLLVGERPTTGVNSQQFLNALALVKANACENHVIGILGPTFSGSYSSLDRFLKQESEPVPCPEPPKGTAAVPPRYFYVIRSSSTMSGQEINWFRVRNGSLASVMSFFDTSHYQERVFLKFLASQGFDQRDVAVLSEDETAYGRLDEEDTSQPLEVYFPRGIASLRAAYQAEASLSAGEGAKSAPRTTLKPDLGTSGKDDDSVPTFDRKHLALSQEAVLEEIMRTLKDHHSRFVMIRATDQMDLLFLAGQLRKSYPQGRVVALGADLLARRDVDDETLRGALSLNPYPPFPGWVDEREEGPEAHRIFSDGVQEGEYNAALDLIAETEYPEKIDRSRDGGPEKLPAARYAGLMGPNLTGVNLPAEAKAKRPWLWVSVVGHDGFWPLAAMPFQPVADDCKPETDVSKFDECKFKDIRSGPSPAATAPEPGNDPNAPKAKGRDFAFWKSSAVNRLLMLLLLGMSIVLVWYSWWGDLSQPGAGNQCLAPMEDGERARLLVSGTAVLMVSWCLALMSWWALLPSGLLAATMIGNVYMFNRRLTRETIAWLGLTMVGTIGAWFLFRPADPVTRFIFLYRADRFTTGVSPNLPLLLMCGGVLWWLWYVVCSRSSFDRRRPLLPRGDKLTLPSQDRFGKAGSCRVLLVTWEFGLLVLAGFVAVVFQQLRLQSLEGWWIDVLFNSVLALGLILLFHSIFGAWVYWWRCRELLVALNQKPLRYAFRAISGFEWRRVWGLAGGNVNFAYQPMVRALEALQKLRATIDEAQRKYLSGALDQLDTLLRKFLEELDPGSRALTEVAPGAPQAAGRNPLEWAKKREAFNQLLSGQVEAFQLQLATVATLVYRCVLEDFWKKTDVRFVTRDPKKGDAGDGKGAASAGNIPDDVQWAEEFVALVYISFIIRVLIRIRWLGVAAIGLYVFLLLSVTVYPFEPDGSIHAFFVFVFLAMLGSFAMIYADMHRDVTLSHLTDTQPGQLGGDYWWRMASFAGVPLLTLVSTQVPQLSRTLFFWVKPLLDGIGKG